MKDKKKSLIDVMSGKEREYISNFAFRIMALLMNVTDALVHYSSRNFKSLGIIKGQTIVDYGCGPARYIKNASETVGPNGKVFAVDIHPIAIENVRRKITKHNLSNVEPVLADGYSCSIPDNIADIVFALDMFHMIEQPKEFLAELSRIAKPDGKVIIEDGHQPRKETRQKIEQTCLLTITDEKKGHVVCIIR